MLNHVLNGCENMSTNVFANTRKQSNESYHGDLSYIGFGDMPLFRDVDIEPLETLLECCRVVSFFAGELLLDPNKGNEFFYLILDGSVSIYLDNPLDKPKETAIATLSVGECVGEMSMFDGKNPSAFVKANDSVRVLAMDNSTLWEMINLSHGLARNLLYLLSKKVRVGNGAVTNSMQLQEKHKKAANCDSLTGLHNRRWLDDLLLRLKGKTLGDLSPLCLMMLDIDHFKKFNDSYGHQTGDEVLKKVAAVMQHRLRPNDMVCRYGGEEFIVILPSSSMAAAKRVAERLRQGIEAASMTYNNLPLSPVTISIGLAQWDGDQQIDGLIADADAALYQAKAQGRNQYCCAS